MDPLSVSASIIGILGAAAKVSSVLITFVKNTKAAPKIAQTVLADVNGLSTVLNHLQTYLLGTASPTRSRASLILVEQVLVTLAECVTTFSELEEVLGTAKYDTGMDTLDSMKWAAKESKVADIQQRLQSNKSSLTLMLTILQCKSIEEAESAMTRLCELVEQVLATNQDMSRRLRNMDGKRSRSPDSDREDDASTCSSDTVTLPLPGLPRDGLPENVHRSQFGFSFEEDLFASRVYRRPLFSDSGLSLATSAARTTASSILSALSLTDVSNISILAVPVYADEISNQDRYTFGDLYWQRSNMPEGLSQQTRVQSQKNALKANRWEGFAYAVSRGRLDKSFNAGASQEPSGYLSEYISPESIQEPVHAVLGVSLSEVIKYSNVAIHFHDADYGSFVYGYIPVYLAKIGNFLKEKGTLGHPSPGHEFSPVIEPFLDDILIGLSVENLFCISGSPLRLQNLQDSFNRYPRFGDDLDWNGYTVHDAASILLRFLNRLPEPVIPLERYEAFQNPLKQDFLDWKWTTEPPEGLAWPPKETSITQEYKRQISLLPGASRQVLLYLLDLFAVIAFRSESNKMTSWRLAKLFQPMVLSPVKAGECFVDKSTALRLSRCVLDFLIRVDNKILMGPNRRSYVRRAS